MKKKTIILAAAGTVVALLAIVYVSIGIYYNSHFLFRTTINGVNSSGKTVAEVEQTVRDEVSGYRLAIEERDGESETLLGTDIALAPEFDGSLERLLKGTSGFAWPVALFRDTNVELETMVKFDDEMLDEVLASLECRKASRQMPPKDACISEYQAGKGYTIVPEEEGSRIEEEKMKEAVASAVTNLQGTVSLEEAGCYEEPKLRADDEALAATAAQLNTYVGTDIVYEFGSDTETLDGDTIHKWISVTKDGKAILDESKAAEFVERLADQYDTAYSGKYFTTSYGSTVTLSHNEYGWRINQEEETAQLLADITDGNSVHREPAYSQRANSRGGDEFGGTYVEINITAQHLYFYKNGSLIVESDFVSGNVDGQHETPSGVYTVTYCERNATLRGPGYATPVSFWMPFNGDIGLHDATWRGDFGGTIYKRDGSHGCVNLPYSAAQTIFNNLKSGDPVVVYELPGTETEKGMAMDAAASVDAMIKALESYADTASVAAARAAYDALNDMAKGYVKNYEALVNAESMYGSAGPGSQEGSQFGGTTGQVQQPTTTQPDQDVAQAQAEAAPVIAAIDAIGTVTPESRPAVENARNLYNVLSDLAKQQVTNYSTLEAAEAALATM